MQSKTDSGRLSGLAPVVLFCFNRPWHLAQTIDALRQNTLASQTELIIYSDGPKSRADQSQVDEVRQYLSRLSGFKSITIFRAGKNKGLAVSVIEGVSETLEKHKNVIVLEDDMLTTPDFLEFMNEALEVYGPRNDIFSVTAYAPPVSLPEHYKNDLFLAPRASSWGWGTWSEKWQKADWQVSDFEMLKHNASKREEFTRGGADLWPMLIKQQTGIIDSWAVRWTYSQFRNNAFGIYPAKSKIKNIGTDGSGTNFTFKTGYYGDEMHVGKAIMDPNLQPDGSVLKAFREYYKVPFFLKIKNRFKYGIPFF